MKILGFDQSLCSSGWCLLHVQEQISIEQYGLISTTARTPYWDRLMQIRAAAIELISLHNPELVVLENVFQNQTGTNQKRASTVRQLFAVETSLGLVAHEANIPIAIVRSERHVKESWRYRFGLAGSKQGKREAQLLFRDYTNSNISEHISDACAITLTGALNSGYISQEKFDSFKNRLNYSLIQEAAAA